MENRNENIKELMKHGIPQKEIAQKYKLSIRRISDIANDKIGPKMWTQIRKEQQQKRRQERRELRRRQKSSSVHNLCHINMNGLKWGYWCAL